MIRRFPSLIIVLAALLAWTLSSRPAQEALDARLVPPDRSAKLAFSDGDLPLLHAIGQSRAITYTPAARVIEQPSAGDFTKMIVEKIVNFKPDTKVLSITSDGRTAILAVGASTGSGMELRAHTHLFLLDTITGQQQDLPSSWYDPGPDPAAALSGDGRLVSIFTEFPMTVTVYDWPTKTLVVKRTSDTISAGGVGSGDVMVDGAIEFMNNRRGRKVVDLKTGGLIAWFGADSVRSSDGAWVVEFPDLSFNESATKDAIVKDGASGQIRGKLDVQVPDNETYGPMTGSFCGATGRFVAASGRGVAVYAIPSGRLLASFPAETWRDASEGDTDRLSVACSPTGMRVAILSGTRLTVHDLS